MRRLSLAALVPVVLILLSCRPAPTPSYTAYSDVVTGASHTCALTRAGAVHCWGYNAAGELGNGSTTNSSQPVVVGGGRTYTRIAAGAGHTCGISQGTVYCWGVNANGQVGDGTAAGGAPVPTPTAAVMPAGVTSFTDVAAGGSFTCAIGNDQRAYCWGQTLAGKLGRGASVPVGNGGAPEASNESVTRPEPVDGGHQFKRIRAKGDNACGITLSNELMCWGDNLFRQLGTAATDTCRWSCAKSPTLMPVGVTTDVAIGYPFICAVNDSYDVACWGTNESEQIADSAATGIAPCSFQNGLQSICASAPIRRERPMDAATRLGYLQVAAGTGFICSSFYPVGQSVRCWGRNDGGQLGDGTAVQRDVPTLLASPLGATSLAAGDKHACLVTDGNQAGRVFCWGSNTSGQLGNGGTTAANSPQRVIEP